MPATVKQIHRPLDGGEMRDVIPARVRESLMHDNTLNVARAFPLIRYKITVELIPYQSLGQDREGVDKFAEDVALVYVCEGEYFTPVAEKAVTLVETSPIYGKDEDPQNLRKLAGMGTVVSLRTNIGELVDVRTKPGSDEPAEAVPLVAIPDVPPPLPPQVTGTSLNEPKALSTVGTPLEAPARFRRS